ncbi:MAG: hypothetical protein ACR2OI_13650 [Acidimicrobiia bacterium]
MAVSARVEDELLVVELTGWDRLLALKGRLAVPLSSVTSVEAKDRDAIQQLPGRWLRLPGTYVPSMVHHGSYGRRPNRDFWALFRQERVLVLRMSGWDYQRLVLGISDPDHMAGQLTQVLS